MEAMPARAGELREPRWWHEFLMADDTYPEPRCALIVHLYTHVIGHCRMRSIGVLLPSTAGGDERVTCDARDDFLRCWDLAWQRILAVDV